MKIKSSIFVFVSQFIPLVSFNRNINLVTPTTNSTVQTQEMEVRATAYQVLDREVKSMGNSGGLYLPKGWVGKKVKVLLLESD